ncbi:TetR family transcriptional regulator [Nocardia sp. FBN12]|uniref:TetR family transcriptional regulator n=1 Tax=Nocardia sp. FBN12 TaxID=3419766 RepID=UPI003D063C1F
MTDVPQAETSRAEATRTRLLESAVEAFAAKGYYGTTTRDIAAAAGMSPAAVYMHHKSKEELLYLISRGGHERILDLVTEAVAAAGTPTQRLHALVHAFVAEHAGRRTVARILNYELAALSAEHLAEIRGIRRETEHAVRSLVADGVRSGDFDIPDLKMAVVAVLSLGIDIARWYRESGDWSVNEVADRYAEMALRIVGARLP